MNYIAAGLTALLSVIVGIIAYAISANLKFDEEYLSEKKENILKGNPAAVFFTTARDLKWKQWLLIGIMALLFSVATVRVINGNTDIIRVLRLLITAMVFFAAFIIDKNTHRIPNLLVLFALGLGAICYLIQFFSNRDLFKDQILTAIVGFLACLVLFYFLSRLTKNGIGMGDVKLLAAQGWLLGFRLTLVGTLFGLLICTAVAMVLLLSHKKKASDTIPFGPFIFAGYMLVLFIC